MIQKLIILFLSLSTSSIIHAENTTHYSCDFNKAIFVDSTGIYEAKKWESKGFSIKDDWVILDSSALKLKLITNIQNFDILRGGEQKKGYQFSLENKKFIYVLLMIPLSRSMTVTGTCKKDNS